MPEPINSIDEYIATCPAEVQPILEEIRRVIRRAAPESEETISYRMPTFTMDGRYLVYVSAWKQHIGVYPIPHLDGTLEQEVSPYRAAKDTLRFPLGEPVPYGLIGRLVVELVKRRPEEPGEERRS